MADFFSVVNFERFQHYKDRSPPWIKFYNSTLSDYAYCKLPDASKAHLNAIWLLASRNNNKVPCDAQWIKTQISATEEVDLQLLADSGFIVLEQGRSNTLATRKQSAMPEKRERREREERETEKKEVAAFSATTDPVKEAASDWNLLADKLNLPKVGRLSPGRRKKWLANYGNGSAGRWSRVLAAIEESEFCQGENDRGWKAGFDFVVTATKIDRLLEGFYRSDPNAGKSKLFKVAEKLANEFENEEVGDADEVSGDTAEARWLRGRDQGFSGDLPARIGTSLGDGFERGDSQRKEEVGVVSENPGTVIGAEDNETDQG